MKHVYVVVCKTGSLPSRIIGWLTGDKYTHASISLDDNLHTMYSFGRRQAYNPFWAGFVKESTAYGTMKRFRKAKAAVIRLNIPDNTYQAMNAHLEMMYRERKKYHYNFKGLFWAKRGLRRRRKNCYYCSEFVKEFLEYHHVVAYNTFSPVVRPVELLRLGYGQGQLIYSGALDQFSNTENLD